ncbi:MAG: HAMP domain-containing sensor histidine kinase [Cyclobacteriaceae bacterium]|nr:MAG: HAMP domain-containing sensor histidine kinase [Cyclobacteriaceae bacterium]
MTTKVKITLTFAILTGVTVILLCTVVFFLVKKNKQQYFVSRLKDRASIVAPDLVAGEELRVFREDLDPLSEEQYFIIPVNGSVKNSETQARPQLPDSFNDRVLSQGETWVVNQYVFHYGQLVSHEGKKFVIVVSARDELGKVRLSFLRNVLIFGSIGSILITVVVGRFFARRVIQPVSAITKEVNRISASNLHMRLPISTSFDELEQLKHTFNDMLDRLETSFEIQSNFINNASHELKTPIATIMAETEILLSKKREIPEYEDALRNINKYAQKLGTLTESLLKLTQTGYDGQKQVLDIVRVDEILLEVLGDLNILFPDNKVNLRMDDSPEDELLLTWPCNRPLLSLALLNIIGNAVKYSDNKEVFVVLCVNDEAIRITITDVGIGIALEDVPHLFEPFFRGKNAGRYTGYGLGLPIAQKIIRIHGGVLNIQSEQGKGTLATISFNRAALKNVNLNS